MSDGSGAVAGQGKAAFVLIHGSWAGGWNWDLLRPLLEAEGHRVLTPTLLGLGEPGKGGSPETGLEAHIDQIEELLHDEDVENAVLVGHSYGGMVITGVTARHPERVARLVYVDAFVPEPKQSCFDIFPFLPEIFGQLDQGGLARVPDLGELFSLTEDELRWVGDRPKPMPTRAASDPVADYDPRLLDERDPCFVTCLVRPDFVETARALSERGWRTVELDTHHYPMISMPERLAQLVLAEEGEPLSLVDGTTA